MGSLRLHTTVSPSYCNGKVEYNSRGCRILYPLILVLLKPAKIWNFSLEWGFSVLLLSNIFLNFYLKVPMPSPTAHTFRFYACCSLRSTRNCPGFLQMFASGHELLNIKVSSDCVLYTVYCTSSLKNITHPHNVLSCRNSPSAFSISGWELWM